MLDAVNRKWPNLRKKIFTKFVFKTDPNTITIIALLTAICAGYFFWIKLFWLGGLLVLLNGFFDILDGEIAKKYGTSKFGDFLDHTFDRIADVAILLGITLSQIIPAWLGFITIIAVLLVSYLGTQAHALTKKRLYTAIASRADRILIIGLGGIFTLVYVDILYWAMWLLLVLSILTFFQRFLLISLKLKKDLS